METCSFEDEHKQAATIRTTVIHRHDMVACHPTITDKESSRLSIEAGEAGMVVSCFLHRTSVLIGVYRSNCRAAVVQRPPANSIELKVEIELNECGVMLR